MNDTDEVTEGQRVSVIFPGSSSGEAEELEL